MPTIDWHALAPEIILAITVVLTLLVDVVTKKKYVAAIIGVLGMFAAAIPLLTLAFCDSLDFCTATEATRTMFDGSYVIDNYALVLKGVFIFAGFITLLLSIGYLESDRYYEGEYYFLIVASVLGGVVMASSRDFISMIVALELVSGPAFMLAGWRKADPKSNEAALKFFIMGVVALALTLFGVSILYGLTGTQQFSELAAVAEATWDEFPLFGLGVLFVVLGFGFKVSAVPFHFWTPDTYEGAPTPVTAWLSVGSKGAGFVALLTVCYLALPTVSEIWGPLLWVVAILSMTVGNIVAIQQTNVMRLLGYSSIAQAGFMLAPFGATAAAGTDLTGPFYATITYFVIYAVMNLGAFGTSIIIGQGVGSYELKDWSGLAKYRTGLAMALAIFFMSLAGVPPLAGWFAKFAMFQATIGVGSGWGYSIAIIAAINAVIAFVYYAKVMKFTFFDDVPDTVDVEELEKKEIPGPIGFAVGLTAFGVIVLGIFPGLAANVGEFSTEIISALGL